MGTNTELQQLSSFILSPDFTNEQPQSGFTTHWQFDWTYTTPDAITSITSFQKNSIHLIQYPRFTLEKKSYQSPSMLHKPIQLLTLTPNQAVYQFSLSPTITSCVEVFVPSTKLCVQKYTFTNTGATLADFALEWFTLLKGNQQQLFSPWKKNRKTGLYQNIEKLNRHILISIDGPSKAGQHSIPSLIQHAQIESGEQCSFFIITSMADSMEECEKQLLGFNIHNWDALFARSELNFLSNQIKIECENQDWNNVIHYSQIKAKRLFSSMQANISAYQNNVEQELEMDSVQLQEDHSQFSIFSIYYLWQVHGSEYAVVFQKILDWVFAQQSVDGQIYWAVPEPLAGLKGNAIPVLIKLVWQIYESTKDVDWLQNKYPALKKYAISWFSELNDKDQDGCPEWRNPSQVGITETLLYKQHPFVLHPFYFRQFEHPGLMYFLITDFQSLAKIAGELTQHDEQVLWQERADILQQHLSKFWHEGSASYQVIDYFTHQNPDLQQLIKGNGIFDDELSIELEKNNRIRIEMSLDGAYTRPVQIKLKGKTGSIKINETINFSEMIWVENRVSAISQYTYTSLEALQISGLKEEEYWEVETLHFTYHDLSMLLPLIDKTADSLSHSVFIQHLQMFGLSIVANTEENTGISSMPWNTIILEKMIEQKNIPAAVKLFSMILDAAATQYQNQNGLFAYYDNISAHGFGDNNHIHGLFPQYLLLKLLGIKMLSSEAINITHFNPFSCLFTVQYKGMRLILHSNSVEIHFRGFVSSITQPGYHHIRLSTNVVK